MSNSCTVCGCSSCCCGVSCATNTAPGCSSFAPIPRAASQPCASCPEDNIRNIINQTYAASVRVQDSWNIPDCSQSAVVTIPGLSQITVGAYLWNPSYGYFQVTAFNSTLQQVTILNNCTDGNSAPGTRVPACTDFNLSPPPCSCNNAQPDLFPYVALDFTAPNDGDCTNITVTNVNGLIAGKEVEIAGGTYTLDSIVSGTVIKICNNGDGLPPGTPVIALDGAGNYQYPIILVDANPCTNPSDTTGTIIVCEAETGASMLPLSSTIQGGHDPDLVVAPVLIDGSDEIAAYEPIDADFRVCTTLSAGLTITSGDATYVLQVEDATDFTIGDILHIQGRSETFEVTGTGVGTIDVTATPTPGANGTVALGKWVCLQTCCEAFEENNLSDGSTDGDQYAETVLAGTTFTSTPFTWSIVNGTARAQTTFQIITANFNVVFATGAPNIEYSMFLDVSHDGGGTWSQVTTQTVDIINTAFDTYSFPHQLTVHDARSLSAGATASMAFRIRFQVGATGDMDIVADVFQSYIQV